MAQESGWLSFKALFSDEGQPREAENLEGPDRDCVCSIGECAALDPQWEATELSDIRLDISDIQEAIKNHDLWVQDAAAMRTDIDDLLFNAGT